MKDTTEKSIEIFLGVCSNVINLGSTQRQLKRLEIRT